MADEIALSAKLLSDVAPDLIVFHCTDTSMTQGPQGEGRILDIVREATGIEAVATSRLVLEALQTLGLKKLVVLSPYKSNQSDHRLSAGDRLCSGRTTWRSAASRSNSPRSRRGNGPSSPASTTGPRPTASSSAAPTPRRSRRSRTIERALGKPVVNSNQAVLWGCVKRLQATARRRCAPMPELGSLMHRLDA